MDGAARPGGTEGPAGPLARSRLLGAALAAVAAVVLGTGCIVVDTGEDPITSPGPPGVAPDAGPSGEAAIARDLFDRLNDERRARDLQPLDWDDQLAELADEWSAEMAQAGRASHRDIDEDVIRDRLDGMTAVGENVFSSTGPVPAGHAHVGWMQSPGHRANLLAPFWDRVGIGVVCTDDGQVYATQNFGRTTASDRPAEELDPPPEEPIARDQRDGPTC